MSDNVDFIEAWNDTIPYKIKPSDLIKPSETFLLNALVNYLYKLNIDVSRVGIEASELRRLEKIKLCHYINHLYTLSDNTNNFFYIDLIHPAPKKTAHLLKILINYYHYYNMVKTEVIEGASSVISNYEDLLVKRNQQEIENEKNKIQLDNVEGKLKEHISRLPVLQEEERQYEMKKEAIDNNFIDLETKLKNSQYTIEQFKTQIDKVKSEMVLESEMKYLLDQIGALDKQLEEYNAMEIIGRENNQAIAQSIPELEEFIKKLEDIIEILNAMNTQSSDSKEMHDQMIIQIREENKIATEISRHKLEIEKSLQNTEIDYQKNIELNGIELQKLLDGIRDKASQLHHLSIGEDKYGKESLELELNVKDLQSQIIRITKMMDNTFKILLNK